MFLYGKIQNNFLATIFGLDNIQKLMSCSENVDLVMNIGAKQYRLENVVISESKLPLSKPTLRGGVYVAKENEITINGEVFDSEIIPSLSKAMLGPNANFENLIISTELEGKEIHFICHLTNFAQVSGKIKLRLIVVHN